MGTLNLQGTPADYYNTYTLPNKEYVAKVSSHIPQPDNCGAPIPVLQNDNR